MQVEVYAQVINYILYKGTKHFKSPILLLNVVEHLHSIKFVNSQKQKKKTILNYV